MQVTKQPGCFASGRAAIYINYSPVSTNTVTYDAPVTSENFTASVWEAGGDGDEEGLWLVGHETGTSFSPGLVLSSFGIAQPTAQVLFCPL